MNYFPDSIFPKPTTRNSDRNKVQRAAGVFALVTALVLCAPLQADNARLDEQVQDLKKEVLELNRDLFLLEEELLFPANSQVALFLSLDVGDFFGLESVKIEIDGKEVANHLYSERETEALARGGVQRIFMGNLKAGEHELVAFFTGEGPHARSYKRGAEYTFTKKLGAKYMELRISDKQSKQQPEFIIEEWE